MLWRGAMPDSLIIERDGPVMTFTLNRPQVRNAIDDSLRDSLRDGLARLHDDETVSVIILTGAGTAFCSGGDIASMRQRLQQRGADIAVSGWLRQQHTAAFIASVHNANQITIAAVNGPAVGLGLDLALACDFIIASENATFAASFVRRGLIPDGGSLYFLPRRIGMQRSKDMVFTGRQVTAGEAARIGLIDKIADDGDAVKSALAYARTVTVHAPSALMLTKAILNRSLESTPETVAALGGSAQAISYTTPSHRSAVEAFLRKP